MPTPTLSNEMLCDLSSLPLPGNVRELENLLYRAVALGDGQTLQLDRPIQFSPAVNDSTLDAPEFDDPPLAQPDAASPAQPSDDLQTQLDMLERALLLQALQATQFNRTAAAERLGLNLRQMRYRMARLNIERSDCDENADDGN